VVDAGIDADLERILQISFGRNLWTTLYQGQKIITESKNVIQEWWECGPELSDFLLAAWAVGAKGSWYRIQLRYRVAV
jgi:hypothetical protein